MKAWLLLSPVRRLCLFRRDDHHHPSARERVSRVGERRSCLRLVKEAMPLLFMVPDRALAMPKTVSRRKMEMRRVAIRLVKKRRKRMAKKAKRAMRVMSLWWRQRHRRRHLRRPTLSRQPIPQLNLLQLNRQSLRSIQPLTRSPTKHRKLLSLTNRATSSRPLKTCPWLTPSHRNLLQR